MLKKVSAFALCLGIAFPLAAMADDSLVKFKAGIGVIPVSSGIWGTTTKLRPGRSLYGLQRSNPVNTQAVYPGGIIDVE